MELILFKAYRLIKSIKIHCKKTVKHRLIINNQVIADFDYFQFLENPIANFTRNYKVFLVMFNW